MLRFLAYLAMALQGSGPSEGVAHSFAISHGVWRASTGVARRGVVAVLEQSADLQGATVTGERDASRTRHNGYRQSADR